MEQVGNVEKAILAAMETPGSALVERVTRHNQIIRHNFTETTPTTCECRLIGCPRSFELTLIPNQALYPKFCEEHRSEFRRANFLRQMAARPDVYRFETIRILETAPE